MHAEVAEARQAVGEPREDEALAEQTNGVRSPVRHLGGVGHGMPVAAQRGPQLVLERPAHESAIRRRSRRADRQDLVATVGHEHVLLGVERAERRRDTGLEGDDHARPQDRPVRLRHVRRLRHVEPEPVADAAREAARRCS